MIEGDTDINVPQHFLCFDIMYVPLLSLICILLLPTNSMCNLLLYYALTEPFTEAYKQGLQQP